MEPLRVGKLKVEIYPTRREAGVAAALAAAAAMRQIAEQESSIGVIFATGISQLDTLDALTSLAGVPWERVVGFHLDEYVGISPEHPASFRRYLRDKLTGRVRMANFFEVDGNAADLDQACDDYAARVRAASPQLCLLGVGENGHLAFNDPGVADFHDPVDVKVVALDAACRRQQVAEGWFPREDDVPERAITLTIPPVLRVPTLIVSVLGARKAEILRRTLYDPISTPCPATILRTHPNATVYVDREAASGL